METQTKLAIGVAVLLTVVLGVMLMLNPNGGVDGPAAATTPEKESVLIREDSHVLGDEATEGDVTFVEFLDFECEACGAAYPFVEQLREEYAGRVTFVARYFPLPGHFNAERAARSVESAARQGKFEEMYQKMYETQESWGEGSEPLDDLFRSYAEELGLDMEQYDADYDSPEVAARVQKDVDDGLELGVQSTPTFYVDGEPVQAGSGEDLIAALEAALGE